MFPIAFPINRDNDDVLLLIKGINIVKSIIFENRNS